MAVWLNGSTNVINAIEMANGTKKFQFFFDGVVSNAVCNTNTYKDTWNHHQPLLAIGFARTRENNFSFSRFSI